MSNIWNLSFITFKYTTWTKGFFYALMTCLAYLGLWLVYRPQAFGVDAYQAEFFKFLYMVMIYYSCKVLAGDFVDGTYKTLFTNKYSRTQIMFAKLLVNVKNALLFWVIVQLLNPIIGFIIGQPYALSEFFSKQTLHSLLLFLLIGLVIGSYSLMLSSFTLSLLGTFMAALPTIWFLYFSTPLILPNIDNLEGIWSLIEHIPFYILGAGLFVREVTSAQAIELVIWSAAFFVVSLFVINLRDIKK